MILVITYKLTFRLENINKFKQKNIFMIKQISTIDCGILNNCREDMVPYEQC